MPGKELSTADGASKSGVALVRVSERMQVILNA